ncbi:MAG: CdvA-like protein [Candidatus Bathyarchaeota archaeon]
MSKKSPNFSLFIGKAVRDEYGRQIGRIVSFATNQNGRINRVFMQHENGGFLRYSGNQFKILGDNIVFLSLIKLRVKALSNKIPLIWRKKQALRELLEKKKISKEMFNDLHNKFEGVLNQLKKEADDTLNDIEKQIAKCTQQVKELNSALMHLEIEREIGKIHGESYETAMGMIEESLKQANAESNDLEAMKSELSNLFLGETTATVKEKAEEKKETAPAPVSALPPPPSLPEPPVLVHMKNVNKQDS